MHCKPISAGDAVDICLPMSPIISKERPPLPQTPEEWQTLFAKKLEPEFEKFKDFCFVSAVKGHMALREAQSCIGALIDRTVHSSIWFLSNFCGLDLKKHARNPKTALLGSMPMLFVTMLLTMLYNAFVFTYMPAAGISFNSPTSIIFHAFIFLVMASFARAASTDPGHIPPGPEWSSKGQPPPEVQERKRCTGEPRWCRKSNVYKPDRAHFCRVLGRVVLRMDHHCPWLGNTVGFANHKYFFLFLLYTNVACSFLGVNIIELLVHLTLPALTTFLLIGAEGLALLLCSFIGPFLFFHCWLIAKNLTTIEFCERMKDDGESQSETSSRYDIGFFRNIQSVLGENPLLWWLPVGGPMGNGLSFRTAEDMETDVATGGGYDPEAAHPTVDAQSIFSAESVPEVTLEARGSVSTAATLTDDWSDFLWKDSSEFVDDLKVGCRYLGEVSCEHISPANLEDFIGRFMSCVGIGKKTKTKKPAAVRPRKIRVVRCHGGSSSGESNNTVVSSSGSEAFAGMRRAGLASNFFDD